MGNCMESQVNKLMATGNLEREELKELLKFRNPETTEYLYEMACLVRNKTQENTAAVWGRIPISSYCKYDCKMCGLRRENQFAKRYRMDLSQILQYCHAFAENGVHHFLLESGDDVYFSENRVAEILLAIKKYHPDAVIVLSMGEKTKSAYRHWNHVGADSYLLRFGTADEINFKRLYPANMSLLLRKQSLWELKQEGYHTGTGFLVGLPYQTIDSVTEDILFGADSIYMGTFIPALRTPFERERCGNGDMALYIMAILRLMLPAADVIAEPSLDCVLKEGRMKAFDAGANVMIADIDDMEILRQYKVYERKNGRFSLPADVVPEIVERLRGKGMAVE